MPPDLEMYAKKALRGWYAIHTLVVGGNYCWNPPVRYFSSVWYDKVLIRCIATRCLKWVEVYTVGTL